MATSLRLPDVLKSEVAAYAADVGISVNALVAVALREYLDQRVVRGPGSSVSGLSSLSPVAAAPVLGAVNREVRRKAGKRKR